jgi:hypothetical protein
LFLTDGAGNFNAVTGTFTGTGAGYVYWTQGTLPTFAVANSIYLFAPTSVTSYQMQLPGVIGAAGQCINIASVVGSVATLGYGACSGATTLTKTCMIIVGADNGAVLANADIAPQLEQCQVPATSTLVEVDVTASGGTPNVIVSKRHCTANPCASNFTVTDLVSAALATAASGGPACSKTGATTGLDTFTTCSATLQNTALAAGDYLETRTATAGGVATRMSIALYFTTP